MQKTFTHKGTLIKADDYSHITIKDRDVCRKTCVKKPCTAHCPSRVYWWREDVKELEVRYWQCLECGASLLICPYKNIAWSYPRGGYGVEHKF